MKLCLIDIGNTNTHFGILSESGEIIDSATIPTNKLTADIIPSTDCQLAIASVVPEANKVFDSSSPFFVTPETASFIDFSLIDASTIGADRVANAATLAKFAELPAVCVDCGTAITMEGLDENLKFHSGPIAPGRILLRKALTSHTAQLPMVDLNSEENLPPPVFSSTTKNAILAGCDLGAVGMVKEMLAEAAKWPGFSGCEFQAAGGDSDYFSANIAELKNLGPNFTLLGVAAVFLENH